MSAYPILNPRFSWSFRFIVARAAEMWGHCISVRLPAVFGAFRTYLEVRCKIFHVRAISKLAGVKYCIETSTLNCFLLQCRNHFCTSQAITQGATFKFFVTSVLHHLLSIFILNRKLLANDVQQIRVPFLIEYFAPTLNGIVKFGDVKAQLISHEARYVTYGFLLRFFRCFLWYKLTLELNFVSLALILWFLFLNLHFDASSLSNARQTYQL